MIVNWTKTIGLASALIASAGIGHCSSHLFDDNSKSEEKIENIVDNQNLAVGSYEFVYNYICEILKGAEGADYYGNTFNIDDYNWFKEAYDPNKGEYDRLPGMMGLISLFNSERPEVGLLVVHMAAESDLRVSEIVSSALHIIIQ
jgi:hypothetical protein